MTPLNVVLAVFCQVATKEVLSPIYAFLQMKNVFRFADSLFSHNSALSMLHYLQSDVDTAALDGVLATFLFDKLSLSL